MPGRAQDEAGDCGLLVIVHAHLRLRPHTRRCPRPALLLQLSALFRVSEGGGEDTGHGEGSVEGRALIHNHPPVLHHAPHALHHHGSARLRVRLDHGHPPPCGLGEVVSRGAQIETGQRFQRHRPRPFPLPREAPRGREGSDAIEQDGHGLLHVDRRLRERDGGELAGWRKLREPARPGVPRDHAQLLRGRSEYGGKARKVSDVANGRVRVHLDPQQPGRGLARGQRERTSDQRRCAQPAHHFCHADSRGGFLRELIPGI